MYAACRPQPRTPVAPPPWLAAASSSGVICSCSAGHCSSKAARCRRSACRLVRRLSAIPAQPLSDINNPNAMSLFTILSLRFNTGLVLGRELDTLTLLVRSIAECVRPPASGYARPSDPLHGRRLTTSPNRSALKKSRLKGRGSQGGFRRQSRAPSHWRFPC